ncbi:MAG TPA: hypothetical protein VF138_10815 [Caulobacteraceae bacterium]
MRKLAFLSLICAAPLALAACNPPANDTAATNTATTETAATTTTTSTGHEAMALPANATDDQIIQSAVSAAPAAVGRDATVIAMNADGTVRTVRKGTNGFTCMADSPATPGPDPMCGDANAMEFINAWIGKKTPPDKPGFIYMLEGGTDASNTDPYAQAPTDANNWVKTGPHVMIVGSKAALAGYPADANPDTTKPYVMWANTPYAHLMIPVS